MCTCFNLRRYISPVVALIFILGAAPPPTALAQWQDDISPLPSTDGVNYEGPSSEFINKLSEYQQVPAVPNEEVTVIPDEPVTDPRAEVDSIQPTVDSSVQGSQDTGRIATTAGSCAQNMNHRVVWALASAGGRNCPAACRGNNGATSAPLVAINGGSSRQPSYLCRTGDPSFKQNRAGFSQKAGGKATPCYAYTRGSNQSNKILAGGSMNCACVADRKRSSFSRCSRPIWKTTKSGNCSSVCRSSGKRIAIPDAPGSPFYVCRPNKSMRIGWVRAERGKLACHYATNNVVTNAKGFSAASVYVFTYQCLCI